MSSRTLTKSTRSDWICLPPSIALLDADDDDDDDAIEIRTLLPQFPQTAPIDGVSTRQCLRIVDLGFRGNRGQVELEGYQMNKGV